MDYQKCLICGKVSKFLKKEKIVTCRECGGILDNSSGTLKLPEGVFEKMWQEAEDSGDYSKISPTLINEKASHIILTSAPTIVSKNIKHEIEIISAECVYGMHIFKDFFAGIRDIVGGRSKAIQDTLRDARRTAMAELRREALMVGGEAVIGVALDYHEITGGGKGGMIMIAATGTAVKLK